MTKYVLGFMFSESGEEVALIRKNRPAWQVNRLNGIGGHVEDFDHSPEQAMSREFWEETGYETLPEDWKQYATLSGNDFHIDVFYTYGQLELLESKTDEKVFVKKTSDVNVWNCIPNLTWLIPLAKSIEFDRCKRFKIEEN